MDDVPEDWDIYREWAIASMTHKGEELWDLTVVEPERPSTVRAILSRHMTVYAVKRRRVLAELETGDGLVNGNTALIVGQGPRGIY